MSAPAFTPGPWGVEHLDNGNGKLWVGQLRPSGEGFDKIIVNVEFDYLMTFKAKGEAEANARLIASAPELYEALDEVLVHCLADIEEEERKDEPNEAALAVFRARRDKAQRALAKARGETA